MTFFYIWGYYREHLCQFSACRLGLQGQVHVSGRLRRLRHNGRFQTVVDDSRFAIWTQKFCKQHMSSQNTALSCIDSQIYMFCEARPGFVKLQSPKGKLRIVPLLLCYLSCYFLCYLSSYCDLSYIVY